MPIAPLTLHPNPILLAPSARVIDFSGLSDLVATMTETMFAHQGVGLAAIQIGVSQRVILTDAGSLRVWVNPEVIETSPTTSTYREGCLSIPGAHAEVVRPERIRVRYDDLTGQTHEDNADGFLATVLQHEIDHTNGVVFLSHLSRLKRERLLKKLGKR